MNFSEFLAQSFAQTEPWAPATIVFGIVALIAFQLFWVNWERRQNLRIRGECEALRIKLEHAKEQLDSTEKRAERERQEWSGQIADWKGQARHDRTQLQRAIPAFERVIRENDELLARCESARTHVLKLQTELAKFQAVVRSNRELKERLEGASANAERLQSELAEFQKRSAELQQVDSDVWLAASGTGRPPPFVHREQRRARFVAFLNLKGGVGKTTLTANLAAAYATGVLGKQLRVLAVDLDHQGTLGNLCVDTSYLMDRRKTDRTADLLLDPDNIARSEKLLTELMAPMNGVNEGALVIVADEKLDKADFRQQAIYAVERTEVRFRHRQFFHQPFVFDNFDLVFFDCPPRLTTSSINALAACDWVIVPSALDPNDVEAVPRALQLLQKLQKLAQVDFHVNLAGVVLNSTYHGGTTGNLTAYERSTFELLKSGVGRFGPASGLILTHTVKDESGIVKAAFEQVPYGAGAAGRDFFHDVAVELYQRMQN
jgi:cellulose biosynthesis protein BcsQ